MDDDIRHKLAKTEYFLEKYKDNKESCKICPHKCGVNRNIRFGKCKEPYLPRVSSSNLHHGEEPPISGIYGSGTIFFSGCNLACVFCQNYPISQLHQANKKMSIEELADVMISLQERKAHNINLVTPSHYIYQIIESLNQALKKGLRIPVVYNTSGYDLPEIIADLEGIVDVYLPDAKYYLQEISKNYSGISNYFEINSQVLKEIYRQTNGKLILDKDGIALNGMVIRHLVLPANIENSRQVLYWIQENLSKKVYISVMSQYFPTHLVQNGSYKEINRRLSREEYDGILDYAENLGFENVWMQEY